MKNNYYIEEVITTNNIKHDEIQQLYINENLSDQEKILHIFKKGFNVQKSALIVNIKHYINDKSTFEYLVNKLIEYLEVWDDDLIIEFAKSITDIYKLDDYKLINDIFKDIINNLLKFIMKIIILDDDCNNNYINALVQITIFYSKHKIKKIDPSLIDFVVSLGYFGKDAKSRRYCIYFSSCLIQISNLMIIELINRIMMLSSDNDKSVRYEIAYHMKYICKNLDHEFILKFMIKFFESYLEEDDLIIKVEIISAILFIYDKVVNHLTCDINKQICEIFTNTENDKQNVIILKTLFQSLVSIGKPEMNNCIVLFLRKYIYNSSILNNYDFLFDNINYVIQCLQTSEDINLFLMFINILIEESDNDSNIRALVFGNIGKLIISINKELQNKHIFEKLFSYFQSDIFTNIRISVIKNLSIILKQEEIIRNEEFYLLFQNSLNSLDSFVIMKDNWRLTSSLIKGLNSVDFVYKTNNELTEMIMEIFKKYLINDNYQIRLEVIKLGVRLLNSKIKDQVINLINDEFYKSSSFYKRRFFFNFVEECINKYSVTFLIKNSILDNLINFMDLNIFISEIIKILPKIIPVAISYDEIYYKLKKKIDSFNINDIDMNISLKTYIAWKENFDNLSESEKKSYLDKDLLQYNNDISESLHEDYYSFKHRNSKRSSIKTKKNFNSDKNIIVYNHNKITNRKSSDILSEPIKVSKNDRALRYSMQHNNKLSDKTSRSIKITEKNEKSDKSLIQIDLKKKK